MSHYYTKPVDTQCFSVALAQQLGSIDLAILIQFFINVISAHKRVNHHQHQGRTWNYCTHKALCGIFPYWTFKQIRTRLDELVDLGILMKGNFNRYDWDQTNWYAFVDEEKWGISNISYPCPNGQTPPAQTGTPPAQKGKPIPLSTTVNTDPHKDNVKRGTMPRSKDHGKTLDFSKRFKLTEDQQETLFWLRHQKIDTDEETLCYWSKKYPLKRLMDVHKEAVQFKAKSIGAYMGGLLKKGAIVQTDVSRKNQEYAEQFKKDFQWGDLQILKKYAKITRSNGFEYEIYYHINHEDFTLKLFEIYKL